MFMVTKLREDKGWSKGELSRRSGVGLSEISRLEAGKIFPYNGWKMKLSKALGLEDADSLFQEVDNGTSEA